MWSFAQDETPIHYFIYCPAYSDHRNIFKNRLQAELSIDISDKQKLLYTILHGLDNTVTNKMLIDIINEFMTLTKRFCWIHTHTNICYTFYLYYLHLRNLHRKYTTETISGRAACGLAAVCNPLSKIKVYKKKEKKKQDSWGFNTIGWEQFPRNKQIVQNHYTDDTDFFSTETINVPIGFRLFAIAQLSRS